MIVIIRYSNLKLVLPLYYHCDNDYLARYNYKVFWCKSPVSNLGSTATKLDLCSNLNEVSTINNHNLPIKILVGGRKENC